VEKLANKMQLGKEVFQTHIEAASKETISEIYRQII